MRPPDIFRLTHLVQQAGTPIREHFRLPGGHTIKEDNTPVTEIDLAVHRKLMWWTESQPNIGYIGEEGDAFTDNTPYVLYVDPLDGTNAYMRGIAAATVAVSVMERQSETKWKPIMSIIHDPINQWTWGATIDNKGFVQRGPDSDDRFTVQVTKQFFPWRVTAVAWRNAPCNMERIRDALLAEPSMEHQSFGATAIGGGLIASGLTNAILFGGKSAVETAAMSLIVRSAGGIATDLSGDLLNTYELVKKDGEHDFLLPNGSIMSSSQELTERLVEVAQRVR